MTQAHLLHMAAQERQRNLRIERQDKAKREDREVREGVAETLELDRERGAEFDQPKANRGGRQPPARRLSGLVALHRKNRITDQQFARGAEYGAVYRLAETEARVRSVLNRDPPSGMGRDIMVFAEKAAQARAKLERFRSLIGYQQLIEVCDQICGQEMTPREAAGNGHGAEAKAVLLTVALDILDRQLTMDGR